MYGTHFPIAIKADGEFTRRICISEEHTRECIACLLTLILCFQNGRHIICPETHVNRATVGQDNDCTRIGFNHFLNQLFLPKGMALRDACDEWSPRPSSPRRRAFPRLGPVAIPSLLTIP